MVLALFIGIAIGFMFGFMWANIDSEGVPTGDNPQPAEFDESDMIEFDPENSYYIGEL